MISNESVELSTWEKVGCIVKIKKKKKKCQWSWHSTSTIQHKWGIADNIGATNEGSKS